MAIREVLVSFTFEQQRQMLNLIGADVGDASLLLTPTNVVVTAINEIINGDVDLSNQTIGMDDGTLVSPSLFWDAGQGFYKVDANKLGLTTSLAVTGNLEVDGDITFRAGSGTGGTLTFGDLDTDNIVFNAEVQSSVVPDSTANYNLGSLNKQWNNLWIDGTASIDTLEVDLNTTLTGNLTVNSGIINVDNGTATTATIFNDYITTAQVLMDATDITIGANVAGSLAIRNNNITTSRATINVFNTIATTVNAFGAASNIVTGLSTFGSTGVNSNFNIRSDDTVLDGDLNVNGGEILSSQNTFDLLISNNDVRIGAANGVGETVINNSLKVTENVNLANSGTNITIKDNTTNSLAIKEGSNTYVQLQTTDGSERVIVYKDLYVVGNLDISGTSTVIDTTTLTVEDKNIELGTSGSPTDALADGGGITLKGTTDKTINWVNSTGCWTFNQPTNFNNHVRIDSSGNVGIGTTSPSQTLDLESGSTSSARVTAHGYICRDNWGTVSGLGNGMISPATNTLAFATNSVERMRIDSSGRVGIGTSSPSGPLDVVSDSAAFGVRVRNRSNDDYGFLAFRSHNGSEDLAQIGVHRTGANAAKLFFYTSGSERMQIDSSGRLLVGTSTPTGGTGHCIVYDENGLGALTVTNTNTTDGASVASFSTATNSTATTNSLIKFFVNGFAAGSGSIVANGTSQAAFASYSDRRLKENIVNLPSQWENIKNLRPVEFDFIEGGHQIGFVAQEFENVYPEAVSAVPSEKNPEEERLTITGWSKTEAYLVKALQEAITKIETLEQRLTDAGL